MEPSPQKQIWRNQFILKCHLKGEGGPYRGNYWISCAELLKRVFYDHLTKCERYGRRFKIIDDMMELVFGAIGGGSFGY